jgi:ABC-2 type transport system permease protein
MVRSELRKLVRQRATWALAAAGAVGIGGVIAAYVTRVDLHSMLEQSIDVFIRQTTAVAIETVASVVGLFLLVGAARLVAMEYSGGTIRVLFARGQGRVAFLASKLAALAIVGLILTTVGLVMCGVAIWIFTTASVGSTGWVESISGDGWLAVAAGIASLAPSLAACILLPTAAAVIGRSTAFAVSVAVLFFPASTIASGLIGASHLPWAAAMTSYLLGGNLNALPGHVLGIHASIADTPLNPVDVPHILGVVLVWCAGFLAISCVLIRRRDVVE